MTFQYVDTVVSGTSWQGGGGGFANEFVVPEAIEITNISSFIFNDGANDVYFYVLPADENGNPDEGNILFGDTMTFADTGWVDYSIPEPIVMQANEKFFVSTLSGGTGNAFGFDGSYPLSMRGWEHTGSYAPSRDRAVQDQAVRFTADSHTGIEDNNANLPVSFGLKQNYPNPFNANTEIIFDLSSNSNVTLEVYNIAGQKISTLVNGSFEAGSHNVIWNGTNYEGNVVSSGVYFYNLKVNDLSQTRKMVLLK